VVFMEFSLLGTMYHQSMVLVDAESHLLDSVPSALTRTCFQQSMHLGRTP
jgi:hypothetical protein